MRGTKNRIVFVDFQSECYVKISSTGNERLGGNSDTVKNIAPTVKHKPYGLDLKSSPGGLISRNTESETLYAKVHCSPATLYVRSTSV